jgi:hypothetical protein
LDREIFPTVPCERERESAAEIRKYLYVIPGIAEEVVLLVGSRVGRANYFSNSVPNRVAS